MTAHQQYDIVLSGGRVVCPAGGTDKVLDLAIADGKITALGSGLSGREIIDCAGKIVTPGLIDGHAHFYTSAHGAIAADEAGVRSGVTTLVDGGSAGYMTWDDFRKQDMTGTATDVYAYLHHHPIGQAVMEEVWRKSRFRQRLERFKETVEANRDRIIGMKDRAVGSFIRGAGIAGVEEARSVCAELKIPYVVHIGIDKSDDMPDRELDAFTRELLNLLAPGDIISHMCTGKRGGVIRADGAFDRELRAARERGVLFDCCCGMTNFSASVFRMAKERGFLPDVVTTDLTTGALSGPARNIGVILSKFAAMGVSWPEVIDWVTGKAAVSIGMAESKGRLAVGRQADITVSGLQTGEYRFLDCFGGEVFTGSELFVPEQAFVAGKRYDVVHSGGPTLLD